MFERSLQLHVLAAVICAPTAVTAGTVYARYLTIYGAPEDVLTGAPPAINLQARMVLLSPFLGDCRIFHACVAEGLVHSAPSSHLPRLRS